MVNLKLRYLIIVILLVLTAAAINGLQYESSRDDEAGLSILQDIPIQLGEYWKGKDFPLAEMVYDILETRAIIHRSFKGKEGQSVFLSIVHYSDTKVDFHAPEACLGGQGLRTTKKNTTINVLINGLPTHLGVAEILTTNTSGQTISYYFYKSGQFIGSNYIKMRLNVATNKLLRNDATGSLVRVSTGVSSGKENEAKAVLVDFLQDLFPHINSSL